jgi:hypothetical protein
MKEKEIAENILNTIGANSTTDINRVAQLCEGDNELIESF